MTPFDVYKTYLAMKKHFTDTKYDYFKYAGKTRSSLAAFNKRRDKYFFERMSRKLSDDEIKMFFIANFVATDNPSSVWIGEIMQSGERHYTSLSKRYQSLTYIFTQEVTQLFESDSLDRVFDPARGHPPVLKSYLSGDLSIETLCILDMIFNYTRRLDKKLMDPVWETVSLKVRKYKPFINIDVFKCKKILRELIHG